MTIEERATTHRHVGPYLLHEEIGSGGMGTVYRAEVAERVPGLTVGDVVALKVVHAHLLKTPGLFKRFLREGEIGKRLRHPNIVATLDLDGIKVGDETILYLAMEYVQGQNLWCLFQELGVLPEELARHLAREVASGLQAIHDEGVVHRDLKPENILVTTDHRIMVMDLGVAHMLDATRRLSETGAFIGSTLYAAPEQFDETGGVVDGRADLYALGVVLYELTAGRHPHEGQDVAEMMRRNGTDHAARLVELNPQVSPFFEEVVHTLLARDPADRFASARDLHEVLVQGEQSDWWRARARTIRASRPLRRMHVQRETEIFGRGVELARLRSLFERASAGEGQVALIEGEAGIGKSRLVDEFIEAVEARGEEINVLVGHAVPSSATAPPAALASACLEFFGEDDLDKEIRDRLPQGSKLAPALAALIRGQTSSCGAEPMTQEAMQTAFVQLLSSLAAQRPTIVSLEDLHNATHRGLALFAALAAAVGGHRLLLVGSTRPELDEDWTASVARIGHAHRVVVSRLGLRDMARMLVAAVGSERLADEIGFDLILKADGNPFFAFEILRGLRENGVLAKGPDGAWRTTRVIRDIAVPSTLQEIVKARVARLAEDDRDLLEVAACCGFEFDPRLVGDAMGVDRVAVLKRLAKLERAHRVVRAFGDRFVFDHRELHQELCAGISDSLRREYHAALASALERREGVVDVRTDEIEGAHAVELADLLLRSGGGERALRYLSPALDHLDGAYRGDEAAELASRALAWPGLVAGDERIEMLLRHAERLELLGRHADQRAAAEEALEFAARTAEAPPQRARALVCLARACRHLSFHDDVLPRLEEALAWAAESGDTETEASAHDVMGNTLYELGRSEEALEHFESELALRVEIGDLAGEASANGRLGAVHYAAGRFEEAHAHFLRDLTLTRKTRSRIGKAHLKLRIGGVLHALGRYEEARAHFARCLSISRLIGFRRGEATALVRMGEVELDAGEVASARRHLETALAICRETGVRYVHGQTLHALAALASACGDHREAFGHAKTALALREEIGDRAGLASSLLLLGRLRRAVGATDAAKAAFAQALDLADKVDLVGEGALAAAHLAQFDDGDVDAAVEAVALHEKRLSVAGRMESRLLLWRATDDPAHLAEAKRLLEHVCFYLPPDRRDTVVQRVPLLRDVSAA